MKEQLFRTLAEASMAKVKADISEKQLFTELKTVLPDLYQENDLIFMNGRFVMRAPRYGGYLDIVDVIAKLNHGSDRITVEELNTISSVFK